MPADTYFLDSVNGLLRQLSRTAAKNLGLGHGHNNMRLNFGSHIAAAMFLCDRRFRLFGCSVELPCASGFNLVAKRGPLTISNGRNPRRGRTALLGFGLD